MSNKYNLNNKNSNSIDEKLESLKHIKKVDAPPYLFTRIKAEINSENNINSEAPAQWKWAFTLTIAAIIVLNISIMFSITGSEEITYGIDEVVETMHMSNNNDLYYSNEQN